MLLLSLKKVMVRKRRRKPLPVTKKAMRVKKVVGKKSMIML